MKVVIPMDKNEKEYEEYVNDLNLSKKVKKDILIRIEKIKKLKFNYIKFTLDLEPKAAKRPRRGAFTFYVPDASKNKRIVKKIIMENNLNPKELIKSEIYIKTNFYIAIPKGFSKTETELAELKFIRPITKPDIDNYTKTYYDCFNGVLWEDDGQIVSSIANKFYSKNPRVEVFIKYRNDFISKVHENYHKRKIKNKEDIKGEANEKD